jgi:hypothetical protein
MVLRPQKYSNFIPEIHYNARLNWYFWTISENRALKFREHKAHTHTCIASHPLYICKPTSPHHVEGTKEDL